MTEITKSNFEEMFPVIEQAIKNASFISIDAEFSGLSLCNNSSSDTFAERYLKLKEEATTFIVVQIGLTTFLRCADKNRYNAETFIFHVRPHLCGSTNRYFSFNAASFDFLVAYDFDFEKFARQGLPFLNEEEEQLMRNEIEENSFFYPFECFMDSIFRRKQDGEITDFLLNAKVGDKITWKKIKSCHDYFQVNGIRRKYKTIWAYDDDDKIIVEKVSPEKRLELEQGQDVERESLIQYFLGFTRVFRLLRDAKKPIVGHNPIMDLLYIFHNFHKPLPKNYKLFKKELHEVFPVIYDTKCMWLNAKRLSQNSNIGKILTLTGLFELQRMFQDPSGNIKTLFTPSIALLNGDKRVENPHEAGYDSYVTGWVFIKMCHFFAMKKILKTALMEEQTLRQHLKAVEPFKNKVHLSNFRARYMSFEGPDPASNVPDYFVVSSKNGKLLNQCQLSDLFSKYYWAEFKLNKNRKKAILTVSGSKAYNDAVRKELVKLTGDIIVEEYNIVQHSFPAKLALWVTLLGSGAVTSYLLLKLFQLHR